MNTPADYAPATADDVTDELVQITVDIVDGWYPEGRIDWEDVYDRIERGGGLDDGRRIDMGTDLASPALTALKRRVRAARRDHG
ncbi:hypothetical protein ACFQ6C_25785 [Streptomyces sp. NPDC056454]|uniref:hypothetical protein n=1 Tax=Streptomyces sp. NPDC056454 TaxID=3345823 RepID=UPI0036CC012A